MVSLYKSHLLGQRRANRNSTPITSAGASGNPRVSNQLRPSTNTQLTALQRLRLHPNKHHPLLSPRPARLSPPQASRPANPPAGAAANRLPHLHPALALPLQWLE